MYSVVWFRQDLRIQDNLALYHACQQLKKDDKLVLLFQVNPDQFLSDSLNHQAFFESVRHFKASLDGKAHLQIQYGEPKHLFTQLKEALPDWDKIYFNQDTSGYGAKRDKEMIAFFAQHQIAHFSFQDRYLHGADDIRTQKNEVYKVFTPYYNKWKERLKATPLTIDFQTDQVLTDKLFPDDEQQFSELTKHDEGRGPVGEQAAIWQLKQFLSYDVTNYDAARDIPSLDQTSHLSQFLRTGELSIRTLWQALQELPTSQGRLTFEKELCWRDFYHMIYTHAPHQKTQPLRPEFSFIKWENDKEKFQLWQTGQTGFPIVDAAMRQLNQTGWMHNRLRMITASFLTKDLLIDWRWGEWYFQKQLIDYDPASNIGGWQWAASTGTDAVPYFRIFNPTTQSEKFDPDGLFIKTYVPELANLPIKFMHQPEKMTSIDQAMYGVILDKDYPSPMVDHKARRKLAISTYEDSKAYYQDQLAHGNR